jgi:hypothetical protein
MESLNKTPNPFEKKPEGKINEEETPEGGEEILEGAADFGLDTPDDDKKKKNKKALKDEINKYNQKGKDADIEKIRKSILDS